MKFKLCLLTAAFAAVGYGWGLGDALKAVDTAKETVKSVDSTVNDAKGAVENPKAAVPSVDKKNAKAKKNGANASAGASNYDSAKRMAVKNECVKELNASSMKNDERSKIDRWLTCEMKTIQDAESEQRYRDGFKQQMDAALAGGELSKKLSAFTEDAKDKLQKCEDDGEIDNARKLELREWVSSESKNVKDAAAETAFEDAFAKKLEAATAQHSIVKSINPVYKESQRLFWEVHSAIADGEICDVEVFFFGRKSHEKNCDFRGFGGNKDESGLPALTVDSAKEYKEKLVQKQAKMKADEEAKQKRNEFARSLRDMVSKLLCEVDRRIPWAPVDTKKLNQEIKTFIDAIDWQGYTNLPSEEEAKAFKNKITKAISDCEAAGEKQEASKKAFAAELHRAIRFGLMKSGEFNVKYSEIMDLGDTLGMSDFVVKIDARVKELREQVAPYAEKVEARDKRLANFRKTVHEHDESELSKDGWKLAKGAIAPATQVDLADLVRDCRDDDPDGAWSVAARVITDQKILKDLLLDNDEWIRHFDRENIMVMSQRQIYYAMYKNVTDQDLLMKLLDIKEIDFRSCDISSLGCRDRAVLEMLDKDHLKALDRKRDARRKAVKGQTIDFNGFYLGMSRLDKEILLKTEASGVDKVGGKYGAFGVGPMSDLWFGAEARHKYLGVKKDGLKGLVELVNKFVPGGIDSTGDPQVGGEVDQGIDPENPDVTVKTWWFINVPKFKCRIRMYDSGGINIYTTDEFSKVILDFSKAEK